MNFVIKIAKYTIMAPFIFAGGYQPLGRKPHFYSFKEKMKI